MYCTSMKNLVIVESPAKAKTIEKFLGKDFSVKSSFGHVRDLPKKGMSIDIDNDFAPTYEVTPEKKKTVAELRKAAKGADMVWLATDEDREGEAIAWHLAELLKLTDKNSKRIVFHEITKDAILGAVDNPRSVDTNVVDAQQARRILDRLVGYELSPVLWKKVRRGLSAGRVQSVAVRLIVEREREIEKFETTSSYKVKAVFVVDGEMFDAELDKVFDNQEDAHRFLESVIDATYTAKSIEQKDGIRSPRAPFTTSTLQQAASQKLGFSVKQTMQLAQRLYEAGKITYMRTDSVALSKQAIGSAASHIEKKFGKDYLQIRTYKTKAAGAQEAHEAIRPTNFGVEEAGADERQTKLYRLIHARALASQMASAKTKKTIVKIAILTNASLFIARGEIVAFDGFLAAYGRDKDDELLPDIKQGDSLNASKVVAIETYTRPSARYTEATLVKKLEEMGIGRPSTYAPTISTIQDRGYVEKGQGKSQQRTLNILTLVRGEVETSIEEKNIGNDKGKLLPTDIAGIVTDFLIKHFADVVDYDFTANAESSFDRIAKGEEQWQKMIADFYKDFHEKIESSEDISRQEATQARELGKDPDSGKPVLARFGRFGPMIQIGTKDDEEKPRFAPMPEGKKIDTVTLEEAMEMFKLPRVVGETDDGEEITANFGRFGPYVKYNETFVSIKPQDPFTISLDKAKELIAEKKKKEADKFITRFEDEGIDVINGRWGPYITNGKINVKIPKSQDPKKIDLEKAKKLIASKNKHKHKEN